MTSNEALTRSTSCAVRTAHANTYRPLIVCRYPPVFRSSRRTTWILQKTYIRPCFLLTERNPKRIFAFMNQGEKQK